MKDNIIIKNGEAFCKKFKQCGGCSYELPYSEELERKQQVANRLLSRFGRVEKVIGMESPERYRCKVTRVYKRAENGRLITGIFKSKSLSLVPVKDCLLEDKRLCEIAQGLCDVFSSFKIEPYDYKSGKGELKHVLLRKGLKTGEIMLCIVTKSPALKSSHALVKAVTEKYRDITTIVHNVNSSTFPLTLGKKENVLFGKGCIEDELMGVRFKISAASFMQVNPLQTVRLYSLARDMLDEGTKTLIDAYCGTGTIGLICADKTDRLIGVEQTPSAVRDARENAKRCNIENAEFICADAGTFMRELAQSGEDIDVVIMDPPRAGADKRFLDSLSQLAPKQLIYISCNMQTLARDMSILKKTGYKAVKIQPVDMFARTRHCECVCKLVSG
ncbi:MAG: 23S rRNA (uracil(1939)-C(5))-methyltransferase RlmD [Ruminococcus sp.]|nr:23S rRNA (uracil(1939)-C(5))-methyltransferase RlmD [Ruminococcus sp.]